MAKMLECDLVVQRPVKERIQKLRQEIAEISTVNSVHGRARKNTPAIGLQKRRFQRLQEIRDELASLIAWKQV